MKLREIYTAFKIPVLYRVIDQEGDEMSDPLTAGRFWMRYRFSPLWDEEMYTVDVTRDADKNILVVIYTQSFDGQLATLIL
jgi:hypothetical protein